MSFLGLDIGTSSCKVVVFNRKGRPIASAAREYAVESPQPDWAELNSQKVGDACLAAIAEAASRCFRDLVEGLAISCQGEAFTVLDEQDHLLTNAMVSSDNRALRQVHSWSFDAGLLYKKTGHTAHPIFSLYKLLWLQKERPDVWSGIGRILCFEDYIHYRLGLEPAISFSLAARTMLFNVQQNRWDSDILAASGIRIGQLSRPLPSGEVVGTLSEEVCRKLNLAPHAVVVTGGHDQVCAALGCGAIRPGIAALGSGTVECITASFSKPILNTALRDANLCTYPHAAPGLYATLAYNLSGGNVLRWFLREFGATEVAAALQNGGDAYDLIAALMPNNPTGLMVLPYFTGSGTPHFDNHTPAAVLGLRLTTSRGEVLRAILEGLCFELEANLRVLSRSGIPVEELRVTGGGAKNRRWLQIKADVFNRPIFVPESTEAGCLGVALLACLARDNCDVPSLVAQWIRTGEAILPNSNHAKFYRERAALYEETYASLRCLSERLF
ncbi:MAG: L-fuculokinase [Chthoniobacteraceae bacterium]